MKAMEAMQATPCAPGGDTEALSAAETVPSQLDLDRVMRQWDMGEDVQLVSDAYWAPDEAHMDEVHRGRLWRGDVHYFKCVFVSAVAAMKMFIHAKRGGFLPAQADGKLGGWHEVMGLMMGHYHHDKLIVTDSFALPVDASEVECSMNENSQLYMVNYLSYLRRAGRPDHGCIGWYHSHPGYSCFLSGIDVNTQQLGQTAQDPWVAVVVDPVSTLSTGRLDFKAFRTYPEDYSSLRCSGDDLSKERVQTYGVHANRYYELPITLIRNTADEVQLNALLGQYWTLSLSTNPLLANQGLTAHHVRQVVDVLGAGDSRVADGFRAPYESRTGSASRSGLSSVYRKKYGRHVCTLSPVRSEKPMSINRHVVERTPHEAVPIQAVSRCAALATSLLLDSLQLSVTEGVFTTSLLPLQAGEGRGGEDLGSVRNE